jgi:hypothetical protein
VKTRDGIVGLWTDRERPALGQGAARPRESDQVSIHGSHQGLRPRPRQQAGHMTARPPIRHAKKSLASRGPSTHDPDVWSGRALQEDFIESGVSGLASMYPAFDWSSMGSWPSWISGRVRSHWRTGLSGPLGSPVFACAGKTETNYLCDWHAGLFGRGRILLPIPGVHACVATTCIHGMTLIPFMTEQIGAPLP